MQKRIDLSWQQVIDGLVPSRISGSARLYLLGSLLNGVANGVFNAVGMLYVVTFGFDAQRLGLIFMMNPLSSTLLMIPAGMLADRVGKRPMIVIGAVSFSLGFVAFLLAGTVETFAVSFLLIGVGNAASTVFTPLYASFFEGQDLDRAFSFLGLVNLSAMSFGSLCGFIPPYLASSMGFALSSAYKATLTTASILFALMSICAYRSAINVNEALSRSLRIFLSSKWVVLKVCGLELLAGIASGLMFSLFPYYLNVKFGVESAALGTIFFVSSLSTALSKGAAAGVAQRIGVMRSIGGGVALSAIFMMLIPFSPSLRVMTVFYILRSGTAFMYDPLITSMYMRSTADDERSTANSFRMLSMNGAGIVAPVASGAMMERLGLDSPAYLGGVLTLVAAVLYMMLLRNESRLIGRKV